MDLSERPNHSAAAPRRHPWELARFQFFRHVLAEAGELRARRVLDAGAGDGWFSRQLLGTLPAAAHVTCWDSHYAPTLIATLACEAGPRVRFTAERPRERFELIMLLDVLEHVERDREFLEALVRENLAPAGAVLLSVPAWQPLFTTHDTRLRHYRRYAPGKAAALIAQSGLAIERRGGLFHGLLLPRVVDKVRELWTQPAAVSGDPAPLDWARGALITRAVRSLLLADNALSLLASKVGFELPGLSWWALCRKP